MPLKRKLDTSKQFDKSEPDMMNTALEVCITHEQVKIHETVAAEYIDKINSGEYDMLGLAKELAFDPRLKSDVERSWLSFQLGNFIGQMRTLGMLLLLLVLTSPAFSQINSSNMKIDTLSQNITTRVESKVVQKISKLNIIQTIKPFCVVCNKEFAEEDVVVFKIHKQWWPGNDFTLRLVHLTCSQRKPRYKH